MGTVRPPPEPRARPPAARHKVRAAPATARTRAQQARSARPATCPEVRRSSTPTPRALTDGDISQLADACQAGAAAR
jgi:hypothetical protein